jgi:hypothetical protein
MLHVILINSISLVFKIKKYNNLKMVNNFERTLELQILILTLFLITALASFLFYQRIMMAQNEYTNSKNLVRNITHGFTRQVKRLENAIFNLKTEINEVKTIAADLHSTNQLKEEIVFEDLEIVKGINNRVDALEESIEEMKKDLKRFSTYPKKVILNTEVEAPIPLQSDEILQRLTDTELEVLKIINEVNEGTVPQIKKTIGKTREHTARLLKKLYESGFIDRNTTSLPYRYFIRKEIKDLIQVSTENSSINT